MKILFICGSLEPGKDGVGDYTRRLAAEMIRQGDDACILAINDKYVDKIVNNTRQNDEGTFVDVYRYSHAYSWNIRTKQARELINWLNPDWISLQLVLFSFHPKGLPFLLPHRLKILMANRKCHIMFHELWIDKPRGYKDGLISIFQRHIISEIIKAISPLLVNVSIEFNKERLFQLGKNSEILPLFGNISFSRTIDNISGFDMGGARLKLLYFGSAPTGEFCDLLINQLKNVCTKNHISLVIISSNANGFIGRLKEETNHSFEILHYNFLLEEEISFLMQKSDIGIGRSDSYLLGKSGSAIAMLEHGLPVWLPKLGEKKQQERFYLRSEIIFGQFSEFFNLYEKRLKPNFQLPHVAHSFKNQLTQIK